VHPKNWFLYLQLSQQEIGKCIELLEDEKYPIIRKSRLFNGEILYRIDNGDKEINGVINDDKNEKEKEINNSTFILACYQIFSFLFYRMCLVWMFGKFPYNTEEVNWFRYIYGNKITTNFFINIKEQRREYENRIKENLKGYLNKTSLTPIEKEKIIERKIKKTAENNIKYYDISIKKNLEDVSKLYGYKVKQPKKIFYNIMLKIIYPSFLRKEYNLYLDV
jgi:hypothetical protein